MTPTAITPQQESDKHAELKKATQENSTTARSGTDKRLWRGDKAGTIQFESVRPDFKGDKLAERQWVKEHMVIIQLSFPHVSYWAGWCIQVLGEEGLCRRHRWTHHGKQLLLGK